MLLHSRFSLLKAAAMTAFTIGTALAAQNATAMPPGWYFGVEGFGSSLDDSENKSQTAASGGGAGPDTCLLGSLIPQLSPLDDLICLLRSPGPVTPAAPGSPVVTRFTFDDGFGGGVTFGYATEGGLRPEVNIGYNKNDIESFSLIDGFGAANGSTLRSPDFSGEVEAIRALVSAWFDIGARNPIAPYVGAGVGFQETTYSVTTTTGDTEESDTTLVYQLGAGLGFNFGDAWTASLDYRYVAADDPELSASAPAAQPFETEYKSQTIGVGIKYVFAPADETDADGDGVPDRKDKCPNTPKGVQVYSDGCPLDLDGDGVPDYLDKCPGTPPGTVVNAQGCEVDSDGDGIPDSRDECPGTPKGVRVDLKGCPLDSDGDGVPDYLDKCPGTPAGVKVNELGCAASDADNDGVPDELDRCKDTPKGVPVGPDGCPLDSDGDGIPDYLDECPNSPPGAKVLPNGCALKGDCRKPRPGEQVDENGCAVEQRFILRGVKFEFDSDRLLPESKEILNEVANTLQSYPDVKVEVEGHTDDIGTDAYNLGLSERRSNAVKTYLAGRGIKGENLSPVGYGESRPIMTNDNETGREENRRVEFKVVED